MNLEKFFALTKNPCTATCISVGTDGLSEQKHNIMSVSLWPDGADQPQTVYIRGANAAAVQQYTGVDPDEYEEKAVGILRAEEILREELQEEMLVSYQVNQFTRKWLFTCFPTIFGPGRHLWFDVLSYIARCDNGDPFPVEARDPNELLGLVNRERGVSFQHAVASRLPAPGLMDPVADLPVLEQRIHHLKQLWGFCKEKEL